MSIPLQYETRCSECKRKMRPGTEVSFSKEGKDLVFWHAGDCPAKKEPAPIRQPDAAATFTFRYCSKNFLHDLAYPRGVDVPPCCPTCGEAWAEEEVAA